MAAAVTRSTSRAGEKAGNLSDRIPDQVVAEVLNEVGAFKLESIFKSVIKVTNSYLKFRFQLFPIVSTTGRSVDVRGLPGDLNIKLLYPNISSLPDFMELLLIKEVGMVEQTGIALNFGAVPGVRFQLQDFLGESFGDLPRWRGPEMKIALAQS